MYEELVIDLGQVGKTCDFAAISTQLTTIPQFITPSIPCDCCKVRFPSPESDTPFPCGSPGKLRE